MLPNIRAVIAAMAAAITLLVLAFGVVATLRVAQESRAGSLHADLTRRGQAAAAEPQPVMVIETPGPTLLAKAPEVEAPPPADEPAPRRPSRPPWKESRLRNQSPQFPKLRRSPRCRPSLTRITRMLRRYCLPLRRASPAAATEPAPEPFATSALVAAAPQAAEAQYEPPSPPSSIAAMGGPSPDEIAQAKEQRKAAERARARKAAAEKQKKTRAARIARERKLAAQRAAEAQPSSRRVHRARKADSVSPRAARSTARRSATASTLAARRTGVELEHDPEKWVPVFG